MRYRKPTYYDQFRCVADRCEESCCLGWQIVIDPDSLAQYKKQSGELGTLLKRGIDFHEACFFQQNRRCSMLRADGLCQLQCMAGEEMLCDTCKNYPRHVEEFEGEREFSLSLSCPEAARMMLSAIEPMTLLEWEDDAEDVFEEFDDLLYLKLWDARERFFQIAKDRTKSIEVRCNELLKLAGSLQACIDEAAIFEMDDVLVSDLGFVDASQDYDEAKRTFGILYELECLHDSWMDTVEKTWRHYFHQGETTKLSVDLSEREEVIAEQILMFFLYTYVLGAVYDDMLYSKVALSVYSLRWILMIYRMETEVETFDRFVRIAYTYAREIEHSDLNLNTLEDFFAM